MKLHANAALSLNNRITVGKGGRQVTRHQGEESAL
jgi:hypothetical protein